MVRRSPAAQIAERAIDARTPRLAAGLRRSSADRVGASAAAPRAQVNRRCGDRPVVHHLDLPRARLPHRVGTAGCADVHRHVGGRRGRQRAHGHVGTGLIVGGIAVRVAHRRRHRGSVRQGLAGRARLRPCADLEAALLALRQRVDPAHDVLALDRATGGRRQRREPGRKRVPSHHVRGRHVPVVRDHEPEGRLSADRHRPVSDSGLLDGRIDRARHEGDQIVVVGEVRLEAEDPGERQGVTRKREVVHLGAGAVGRQSALDRDHAVLARTELGDVADDERERRVGRHADALPGRVVPTDAGPAGDRYRRSGASAARPAGGPPRRSPPFRARRCGRSTCR